MLGGRFFKRGPLSRRYHEGSHGKGNVSIQHFGASGAAGSGACAPALTGGNNDRPGEHALPQQPPPDAICGPAVDGLLLQALSRRGRNVRARGGGRGGGDRGGERTDWGTSGTSSPCFSPGHLETPDIRSLAPQWTRRALPAFSTLSNGASCPGPNVASHVQRLQPSVKDTPVPPIFRGSTTTMRPTAQRGPSGPPLSGVALRRDGRER